MAIGRKPNHPPSAITHPVTRQEYTDLFGILDCLAAHYNKLGVAPTYTSTAARNCKQALWAHAQTCEYAAHFQSVPEQKANFTEKEVQQEAPEACQKRGSWTRYRWVPR
jgi:hypothetical protein